MTGYKEDMQIFEAYPEMTSSTEEIRDWIERVQTAAVKARSNTFENQGQDELTLEMLNHLDPHLFNDKDPLNLITVTMAMLDSGREVTASDLVNINYLVSKSILTQALLIARPT